MTRKIHYKFIFSKNTSFISFFSSFRIILFVLAWILILKNNGIFVLFLFKIIFLGGQIIINGVHNLKHLDLCYSRFLGTHTHTHIWNHRARINQSKKVSREKRRAILFLNLYDYSQYLFDISLSKWMKSLHYSI